MTRSLKTVTLLVKLVFSTDTECLENFILKRNLDDKEKREVSTQSPSYRVERVTYQCTRRTRSSRTRYYLLLKVRETPQGVYLNYVH